MKTRLLLLLAALPMLMGCSGGTQTDEPMRVFYVTGGGFHDYEAQRDVITNSLSERLNIEWTIDFEAGVNNDHMLSFVDEPGWYEDFDVVIYNMCFAGVTDNNHIERLTRAHYTSGLPAVLLHCAMHTYRDAETDEWDRFVGFETYRHDRQRELVVEILDRDHPVMRGFPAGDWHTPIDELYLVISSYDSLEPLAHSYSVEREEYHVMMWANTYGNAQVIGTTAGHNTEVMETEEYLNFLENSLIWLTGNQ